MPPTKRTRRGVVKHEKSLQNDNNSHQDDEDSGGGTPAVAEEAVPAVVPSPANDAAEISGGEGETQTIGDDNEEGDDDDEEDEASAIPAVAASGGLSRRGRGGSGRGGRGGGGRPGPKCSKRGGVAAADDDDGSTTLLDLADYAGVVDGIEEVMKGVLLQCVDSVLGAFGGGDGETPENKREKKRALKSFHDLSISMTTSQECARLFPATVNEVYRDLDVEKIATEEENDEQFLAVLDQFEETAKKEVKDRCKMVGMKQVVKNPVYQHFLEGINRYVNRGDPGGETNDNDDDTSSSSVPGPSAKKTTRSTRNTIVTDSNGFSEGFEVLTEYIPTTDPITRKLLKNPYKNRKCGHVYEYDSIMGMIITSGSKSIKCPYPSCNNKTAIKPDDLVKDAELARKIAEKIEEERHN